MAQKTHTCGKCGCPLLLDWPTPGETREWYCGNEECDLVLQTQKEEEPQENEYSL